MTRETERDITCLAQNDYMGSKRAFTLELKIWRAVCLGHVTIKDFLFHRAAIVLAKRPWECRWCKRVNCRQRDQLSRLPRKQGGWEACPNIAFFTTEPPCPAPPILTAEQMQASRINRASLNAAAERTQYLFEGFYPRGKYAERCAIAYNADDGTFHTQLLACDTPVAWPDGMVALGCFQNATPAEITERLEQRFSIIAHANKSP